MNIYVSKLSFNTTSESLKQLFAKYGETTSANIITDRGTGFSRGFGFVEMTSNDDGKKAIEALDNTEFEGKTINVSVARPRNDRNGGNWGNRGGGGHNNRY
jgi:RNA recognition motif-containing protein